MNASVMPGSAIAPEPAPAAARKVLVGLIGAGIQRSLTPAMHEEEARHHGLRLHYQLIDLDRGGGSEAELPGLLAAARTMGFAGLNITYPCKQAVIPLLDELSEQARSMGAVNTVVNQGGKLVGHNTDGSGWSWGFRRRSACGGWCCWAPAAPARPSRIPCCGLAPTNCGWWTATANAPACWRSD
jgi:hypothetical protein